MDFSCFSFSFLYLLSGFDAISCGDDLVLSGIWACLLVSPLGSWLDGTKVFADVAAVVRKPFLWQVQF